MILRELCANVYFVGNDFDRVTNRRKRKTRSDICVSAYTTGAIILEIMDKKKKKNYFYRQQSFRFVHNTRFMMFDILHVTRVININFTENGAKRPNKRT